MRVRTYGLLSDCVEKGIRYGLNRCEKYELEPGSEEGVDRIHQAIMGDISEYFDWDDEVVE